jgi:GDP-4-dehydro-6-deoxy-D-mannose reductase
MHKYPYLDDLKKDICLYVCDLEDSGHTEEIIKKEEPDCIFHYAAISFVPTSVEEPSLVFRNNVESTMSVLKACSKLKNSRSCRVYTALSSEQ